jgi:hypothetical protein
MITAVCICDLRVGCFRRDDGVTDRTAIARATRRKYRVPSRSASAPRRGQRVFVAQPSTHAPVHGAHTGIRSPPVSTFSTCSARAGAVLCCPNAVYVLTFVCRLCCFMIRVAHTHEVLPRFKGQIWVGSKWQQNIMNPLERHSMWCQHNSICKKKLRGIPPSIVIKEGWELKHGT